MYVSCAAVGYTVNLNDMNNNGLTQEGVFDAFVGSAEWAQNPSLSDKSAFVTTVSDSRTPSHRCARQRWAGGSTAHH